MNLLYTIMAILIIIWAILNIILFFKIWGMTKNVAELKTNYLNSTHYGIHTPRRIAMREILRKNPDIENILFDCLYDELCANYDTFGIPEKIIVQYRTIYEKAGVSFPECFNNIAKREDVRKEILFEKI